MLTNGRSDSMQDSEAGHVGMLLKWRNEQSTSYPKYFPSVFCENSTGRFRSAYARKHERPIIAVDSNSPGRLVALKHHKRKEADKEKCLLKTSHTNIVNLLDAFLDGDIFHFVYELMEVSLRELSSCVPLGETDISFICKEVRPFPIHRFCSIESIHL
jgi:serine/threonine protein kinase